MPAHDEFAAILERCETRLSEIELRLPDLEAAAPRPPKLTLDPPLVESRIEPPPPRTPAPVPAAPPPAPRTPEPRSAAVEPPPVPAPLPPPPAPAKPRPRLPDPEPELEHEVFPPPGYPIRADSPTPTPLLPPARFPTRAAVAAGSVALALAAAGVWYSRRGPSAVEIALPSDARAASVRPDGALVLAQGSDLVTLERDGSARERLPLDRPAAAVRWANGALWTIDGVSPSVVLRRGARPTSFALNHVPTTIFVRGQEIWTADADGVLHQYLLSGSILGEILQPLDSYPLAGVLPATIAVDDAGELWVADQNSRRLLRMKNSGAGFSTVAWAPLSPAVGPSGALRGLSVIRGGVWLMSVDAAGRAVERLIPTASLTWNAAQ